MIGSDRELLEDVVYGDTSAIDPYVDVPKMRRIFERYAASPATQDEDAFTIFLVVTLATWIRGMSVEKQKAAAC
jgi:hypothetical protein